MSLEKIQKELDDVKQNQVRHDERIKALSEDHKELKTNIDLKLASLESKMDTNNAKVNQDLGEIKDILTQAKGVKKTLSFIVAVISTICAVIAFLYNILKDIPL